MRNISLSNNGDTPFQQSIGHNPQLLQSWKHLEETFLDRSTLSSSLLEEVRSTLAVGNECKYCMAKGKPKQHKADQREVLATSFAELFTTDIESIQSAHFEELREGFSDSEISELCAFISFTSACQQLGRIFNL